MTSLPPPRGGFEWRHEPWGPLLVCAPLEAVARHAFTSRQLGLRPGESAGTAWRQVAASVGCAEVERIGRVRQVHGAAVRVVRPETLAEPVPDADAIVTASSGLAVAVVSADCVPVLLADPRTGAVAAVHAGWRGTAANVVAAAIDALQREFSAAPATLVAAIGPSIGACCYQVGEELRPVFTAAGHSAADLDRWFLRHPGGQVRLDLWRANADLLARAGVQAAHIHVSGLCTKTHRHVFESFRADGDRAGRMAAIIVAP
jgi:YfiH family protein